MDAVNYYKHPYPSFKRRGNLSRVISKLLPLLIAIGIMG